jgi:hypothetical protein
MYKLRTVYVLSCALLLGDVLSQAALANDPNLGAEQTSANPCESRGGQTFLGAQQEEGNAGQTIRGEVLRVEGSTYVVRSQDGKEVSLQTDQTRKKPAITQGNFIQANVNAVPE